jgi:RNA 2',3'-cyclic 3'-phosphodiesterase
MRLFTGIDLPDDAINVFERLLARFRPVAHLKWSPAYNLHITARFIGEWPEARLDELKSALATVAPRKPIAIALRGLGWFPNAQRPRVFWTGVDAGPELGELAHDINGALETLGLAKDERGFSPHLTLARIKQPVPLDKLHGIIENMESTNFASFQADRFYLYRSQPGSAGSIYTKLSEFRFVEATANTSR